VPQDVAIISRDDESYLEHLRPSVARYSIDPALFPRRLSLAARQLAETGTFPPHAIRLIPKYLPGDSI
jgi:hypothetical protein